MGRGKEGGKGEEGWGLASVGGGRKAVRSLYKGERHSRMGKARLAREHRVTAEDN